MSEYGSGNQTPSITLKACAEELRRRCAAVARFQGGHTHYLEEIDIFNKFVEEHELEILAPATLNRPPDDEGNEHQVWYEEDSSTYLKATWPEFYGMRVIHRHDEEPKASPIDYIERWHMHNELFGDQVEFLGSWKTDNKQRLLIRQPAITGSPATVEEIQDFFTHEGWKPFRVDGELAFFDSKRQVVISDTHRGNIILMDDGLLAPIDLRVQRLQGALLDTVEQLSKP